MHLVGGARHGGLADLACQVEALETAIYITEGARKYGDAWIEKALRDANDVSAIESGLRLEGSLIKGKKLVTRPRAEDDWLMEFGPAFSSCPR